MEPVTLYVCTTCRMADDPADGPRAGRRLFDALGEALATAPAPVRLEPVECLSVCKRPCTVAVASPGRWTYVYGDFAAAPDVARTILDGLGLYADTPDGLVPWRARPESFRKGVVARIPPAAAPPPEPAA